nr:hypothetical protein [Frisingicoccus caecimuris]
MVKIIYQSVLTKPNNMELCFEEEDFDGFLNKLKKYPGIECLGEVIEYSWGQRVYKEHRYDFNRVDMK